MQAIFRTKGKLQVIVTTIGSSKTYSFSSREVMRVWVRDTIKRMGNEGYSINTNNLIQDLLDEQEVANGSITQ